LLRAGELVDALRGPSTHDQHVPKHAQRVDRQLHLAAITFLGSDGDLHDRQTDPVGEEQQLGVEREAI
jgi:hypothetical protein